MMLTNSNFQTFAELDAALNDCVRAFNRLGIPSINGADEFDFRYTVNGVPGMASIFRAGNCWTFTTEI